MLCDIFYITFHYKSYLFQWFPSGFVLFSTLPKEEWGRFNQNPVNVFIPSALEVGVYEVEEGEVGVVLNI